jgi:hypothetical protein
MAWQEHFEPRVVGEECLQQIPLGPGTVQIHQPPARVLVGQEDVVEMNHHPWTKHRQNVQDQPQDVAPPS